MMQEKKLKGFDEAPCCQQDKGNTTRNRDNGILDSFNSAFRRQIQRDIENHMTDKYSDAKTKDIDYIKQGHITSKVIES